MDPHSLSALAELLQSGTEDDSAPQRPGKGGATQPALTPASLIPNSVLPSSAATSSVAPSSKKINNSKHIWEDSEAVAAEEIEDPHDTRKRANFEVLYKQRVGSEDVYLGLGEKTPSTLHCDTMVVRITLPPSREGGPAVRMADIDLKVSDEKISVSTSSHKLSTYLPLKTRSKEGSAQWDGTKHTLTLTLPIIRDDF